ncbi:MAG TPA: hypothetical protein EYP63_07665 [Desulfotomaculum sp.]|nr:hypothetical protein [Desulfotomaculum sp.]
MDIKVFEMAPYDLVIKIGTYGLSALFFLGVPGCMMMQGEEFREVGWVTLVISGLWLLVYLFVPLKYIVSSNQLVIKRLVCSIALPYEKIASLEIADNVKPEVKVFANAGLFCYAGLVLIDNEIVRIYATNLKRMIRIKTTDAKTWYISPADPDRFVAAVNEHLCEKKR